MPLPGPGQAPMYSGAIDCVKKTVANEGAKGLYKGKKSAKVRFLRTYLKKSIHPKISKNFLPYSCELNFNFFFKNSPEMTKNVETFFVN